MPDHELMDALRRLSDAASEASSLLEAHVRLDRCDAPHHAHEIATLERIDIAAHGSMLKIEAEDA